MKRSKVESPKQTLSLPVQTRGRGVSKTVFSPKTPLGRPKLQNRGQDVEAGDKNSRLAALAAWNAAADAERLEASMRRRHSTKQREIPALGRAIRVAEKNAPRGHYDVLQLPRKATPEDIQKSFRKRALVTHPDKGGRPEDFQAVVAAFEVLTNSLHREEYDRSLNALGNTDGGMDAGSLDMDAVTDMGSEELAARRAVREALIRLCSASPAEQKRILKELQTEVLEEAMEFLQSAHAKSAWNMEFTQFRNTDKSNSLSMAGIYADMKGRYAVELSWEGMSVRTQTTVSLSEAIDWHITLTQLKARAVDRINLGYSPQLPLTQEELAVGYRTSPAMYLSFYCDWGEKESKRQTITPATSDLSLAVKIKHRYDDIFAQEEEALAAGGKSPATGHKLRALKEEVETWIEQELQEEFVVLKIMAAELRNRHKKAEREDWIQEAQSAIELRDLLGLETTGLHTSVAKLKYLDTEQKSATRSLLVGDLSLRLKAGAENQAAITASAAQRSPRSSKPRATKEIADAKPADATSSQPAELRRKQLSPVPARPGASQSSGRRRGSLDPDECGEYQLRRSAEDLRKAILSPLLPSSQTGRQPDAVIRATLNHSALPGWSALRACARVVRVTVDAHITRTFKNFVYNEHWFQWENSSFSHFPLAQRLCRFMSSPIHRNLFSYMDLGRAPVDALQDVNVQTAISQMPRLQDVVFPIDGWASAADRSQFLSCLPPGASAWGRRA